MTKMMMMIMVVMLMALAIVNGQAFESLGVSYAMDECLGADEVEMLWVFHWLLTVGGSWDFVGGRWPEMV
jgi:hypothetical protein